ncbi:putative gibberellin 2-beta-dioxygenase 1-like [Capsicum annuum]|nr:putative gibberellin 2-beta-dioxygenase 1-like [Capsicum annuum]KAF3644043.1 putative gibberellin 2-beta-dioxygenase 1-like [Capsicum annuum]
MTPLFMAAESGFHDTLINIMESCKKLTYATGPSNRMLLHATVIQKHRGLEDVVSDMMGWTKSLVYLPAGSENDWMTAIHIAASKGGINMINKLLYHCPDCWDTLNNKNQNALHVDEEKLVEDLCSIGRFGKCDFEVKRKYKYMPNPNDDTGTGAKIQLNDEAGIGVKMQLREDDHDKAKKADKTVIESIMKRFQLRNSVDRGEGFGHPSTPRFDHGRLAERIG